MNIFAESIKVVFLNKDGDDENDDDRYKKKKLNGIGIFLKHMRTHCIDLELHRSRSRQEESSMRGRMCPTFIQNCDE